MNLYQLILNLSEFTQYPNNIHYNPQSEHKICSIIKRHKTLRGISEAKEYLFSKDSEFRELSSTEQELTILLLHFKEFLK